MLSQQETVTLFTKISDQDHYVSYIHSYNISEPTRLRHTSRFQFLKPVIGAVSFTVRETDISWQFLSVES